MCPPSLLCTLVQTGGFKLSVLMKVLPATARHEVGVHAVTGTHRMQSKTNEEKMSKASLKPNPPFSSLAGPSQCANAAPGSGLREGVLNVHAIPSPSLAGPSSWPLPALKRVGQGTDVNKGLTKMKNRTVEEDEIQRETAHRFAYSQILSAVV